jgi:hypothetical protein
MKFRYSSVSNIGSAMLDTGQRSMSLVMTNTLSTTSNTTQILGGIDRIQENQSSLDLTIAALASRIGDIV